MRVNQEESFRNIRCAGKDGLKIFIKLLLRLDFIRSVQPSGGQKEWLCNETRAE